MNEQLIKTAQTLLAIAARHPVLTPADLADLVAMARDAATDLELAEDFDALEALARRPEEYMDSQWALAAIQEMRLYQRQQDAATEGAAHE